MENRLSTKQLLFAICLLLYSLLPTNSINAQSFVFSYTGSDTLYLDSKCTTELDWGHPDSINFSSTAGHPIDTFYISAISGNYMLNDTIRASETIYVSYFVQDTTGANETLDSVLKLVIADTLSPIIITPAKDTLVSCVNTTLSFSDWLANHGLAIASDACSTIDNSNNSVHWSVHRIDTISSACGDTTQYITNFGVQDEASNSSNTVATYTLIDTIAPQITGVIADINEQCGGGDDGLKLEQWFLAIKNSSIQDGCNGENLEFVEINYTDKNGFAATWTTIGVPLPNFIPNDDCAWYLDAIFTFRDACGKIGFDTARYAFIDTIAPLITQLPNDTMLQCDQMLPAMGMGIMATDNCDVDLTINFAEQSDTTDTAIIISRTWSATDDCNNTGIGVQTITIVDTIAPVLENIPSDTIVTCDNVPDAPLILTATDNCTDPTEITFEFKEVFHQLNHVDSCQTYNYTITRTWIASDIFNNTDSMMQLITVIDTIAPTFSTPADITISCELRDSLSITGQPSNLNDACDPVPDFSFIDLVIGGDCVGGAALDTVIRTWTVMDACGNMQQDIQRIILIDTTGPSIIGLASDTMILCSKLGNALPTIGTDIIAVDECTSNPIIQFIGETNNQGSDPDSCDFYNYNILRTWRATDACGNTSDFVQTVHVIDTLAPTLICPSDISMASNVNTCTGTVRLPQVFYFDNCTPNTGKDSLSLMQNFTNASVGNIDSIPVDSLIFHFNIGATSLTKTITSDLVLNINLNNVDGEDSNEIFSIIGEDGHVFAGTNPAATECGNSSTSIQISSQLANEYAKDSIITFVLGPNGIGAAAINNICPNGSATLTLEYDFDQIPSNITVDYAIDGGQRATFNTNIDTTLSAGIHPVTYYVTDCSGNTDSCKMMISILDQQLPIFNCPASTTAYTSGTGTGTCVAAISLPLPSNVSDNCDDLSTYSIQYSITNKNTVDTGTFISSNPILENLKIGMNEISYILADSSGNTTSCSFNIEVLDTIPPSITCKPTYNISANLSGAALDLNSLQDSLLNDIEDNCDLADISIMPMSVSCSDTTVIAIITARDSSGNTATCQTTIQLTPIILEPTFSMGFCNNDTLYLFADTLDGSNTNFTYNWTGPSGFTSTQANPFIANASLGNAGSYTLNMTGPSGCTATGNVFININNEGDIPPIRTSETTICSNESILLSTNTASCSQASYQWFEVIDRADPLADTTILVGTSTVPTFSINAPVAGRHAYYLIVNCDECASLSSEIISITVFEVPTAVTSEAVINVCEGETINLSSPLNDPSCTYKWVGPGFTADLATPAPIPNAAQENEGVYTLTVSKNGCISEAAFTIVNITNKPSKPNIANESGAVICTGNSLILKTDIINGNVYNWTNTNTLASYTTTIPEFKIDSTSIQDAGNWNVSVEMANCISDVSNSIEVIIEAKPSGAPFFEGAACAGRTVQLNVNPVLTNATYEWNDIDSMTFFGANPEVPVRDQYILKITSENACTNTKVLAIDIKETPVITSIFDSGDSDPCVIPAETDLQLTATVFPANDGTYAYQWTLPNGTLMSPIADSILVVPNVSASAANGNYTLMVTNGDNCTSDPISNTVDVTDVPLPTPVITANKNNLCEGETLQLSATEYPNISANYRWQITSLMDTITQSPILILDSVTTALNGTISLEVFNGDCPSVGTANLTLTVNQPLAQPSINTNTNFCSGEVIRLNTTEIVDATYLWEGPSFTATSSIPEVVISGNAGPEHNGNYTVQTILNGCTSPKSEALLLNIFDIPMTPIANNGGNICIDNNADIILFIDQENIAPTAEFSWYNAANDTLVSGPSTLKSQIIDLNKFPAGTYQFYATQTINGCESPPSNLTELTLANIPSDLAQVCESTKLICNEEDAIICALAPSQGIGTWTVDNPEVIIENPNSAIANISGIRPGSDYTFFWTLSNDICGEYSAARLEVSIGLADAVAKVCNTLIEACDGNTVSLCADPIPNGYTGRWSQPSSQAALGVVINDSTNLNTMVSNIEASVPYNAYTFFWTVIDSEGICEGTDTVRVNMYGIPTEKAVIDEAEIIACNGEEIITALPFSDGLTGRWSSPNNDLIINTPTNFSTNVENLSPGSNILIWSLSSGACIDYSSDEIIIFSETPPNANDDVFTVDFGKMAVFDVAENDQVFSPEYDVAILSNPQNGTVSVNPDGTIRYEARQNYVGTDVFTYELCNPTCATECSEATVQLTVGEDAECIIPTIITPNGDNINDAFLIPCFETGKYINNEVVIFNRWGDEIFRAAPYNNDWQGTYKGENIPAGTYYYVVSFDKNTEPTAGFLLIER